MSDFSLVLLVSWLGLNLPRLRAGKHNGPGLLMCMRRAFDRKLSAECALSFNAYTIPCSDLMLVASDGDAGDEACRTLCLWLTRAGYQRGAACCALGVPPVGWGSRYAVRRGAGRGSIEGAAQRARVDLVIGSEAEAVEDPQTAAHRYRCCLQVTV